MTVVRDRKIRTALRTNQIAEFVTVTAWKKIKGDIFGLMGKFFKISIFNILTGQKRRMTELKLVWPVNRTGHCLRVILSPVVTNCECCNSIKVTELYVHLWFYCRT